MDTNRLCKQRRSSVEWPEGGGVALFTDLYELTMLQAYCEEWMTEEAVFSLFVRRLPSRRNFLLACGLDTVLDYLEHLSFGEEDVSYLRSLGRFSDRFLGWLQDFRFTGEVRAVAEGTPVFADEPILEIAAPLPEGQVAETFIMNQVHLQTVLASKAQRVVHAAAGCPVIDFGSRRMHGIDAALKGARAFSIGGVVATSNVLAGKRYGLAVAGTMAHSYIQTHQDERGAFRRYAERYPGTILLIDTYDTMAAVKKVIDLAEEMGDRFAVRGVRLDSGNVLKLSQQVRQAFDEAGLHEIQIFASGGLDEYEITRLIQSGAPIDGFGVGTAMGVSSDEPVLDIVYKLCEYAGKGRVKLSTDKPVLPGRKQVFRLQQDGNYVQDTIAGAGEDLPGKPLLTTVMRNGKRLQEGRITLEEMSHYAQHEMSRLPAPIRSLAKADPPYPVRKSVALASLQRELEREVANG